MRRDIADVIIRKEFSIGTCGNDFNRIARNDMKEERLVPAVGDLVVRIHGRMTVRNVLDGSRVVAPQRRDDLLMHPQRDTLEHTGIVREEKRKQANVVRWCGMWTTSVVQKRLGLIRISWTPLRAGTLDVGIVGANVNGHSRQRLNFRMTGCFFQIPKVPERDHTHAEQDDE